MRRILMWLHMSINNPHVMGTHTFLCLRIISPSGPNTIQLLYNFPHSSSGIDPVEQQATWFITPLLKMTVYTFLILLKTIPTSTPGKLIQGDITEKILIGYLQLFSSVMFSRT